MTNQSLIAEHINSLCLTPDASRWLIDVYEAAQFFDDVFDGDHEKAHEKCLDNVFRLLVLMPSNPFFYRNAAALLPIIHVNCLKWVAANNAEKNGAADEKSFVWRAGYYDLVLAVFSIEHGPQNAAAVSDKILSLYGEKLDDYLIEMRGLKCQTQ